MISTAAEQGSARAACVSCGYNLVSPPSADWQREVLLEMRMVSLHTVCRCCNNCTVKLLERSWR